MERMGEVTKIGFFLLRHLEGDLNAAAAVASVVWLLMKQIIYLTYITSDGFWHKIDPSIQYTSIWK